MSGPDPKRMYIAINLQNVESLKAEKPYWSKPFVFVNASGSGPRYTSLQAAMVLQKLKAVEFLIDQPSIDLDVKSTDGKSTLIIAVESKMSVTILEKILNKLQLRCLSEVDSSGKGPLDYVEPGTEVYEFLHSMGCKTRAEREAAIAGFFGEEVKGTVPGVSEHQRRRKKAKSPRKKEGKKAGSNSSSRSGSEDRQKSSRHSDVGEAEEAVEDNTWKEYQHIDDLEAALQAYVDEWGEDHEEGQSCAHWLKSIAKAREVGKTEKVLAKWNAKVGIQRGKDTEADADRDRGSESKRGRSRNRSASAGCSESPATTHRAVDPEAVKLFFSGKAEDQLNLKHKSKHSHRLTYVVERRTASSEPSSGKGRRKRDS